MKAAELIRLLSACDPDLEVDTEGCDCDGDVAHVVIENGGILLARSDGDHAAGRR